MTKKKYLVEKRNVLNEIIARQFTLQELRLFSIYLGRINPRDPKTRVVRFPLTWFYQIMDLQPLRVEYLETVTHDLLTKVIRVIVPVGGYEQFQLFKKCKVSKDANNEWYFEFDAHDDALPLMFEYKRDYFTYELWNVLNLESINQVRMYEILKQYEYRGVRIISVIELKSLLGIDEKEYLKFNDFKKGVLNACQQALKEKTDIYFTYEPYARSGRGGRIQSLRFTIAKNVDYKNLIKLEEFIEAGIIENIKQEFELDLDHKVEPAVTLDISRLDFIKESLTNKDKLSILRTANGDTELVQTAYEMAKNQGGIENLVAWLIAIIIKLRNGEVSPPIKIERQKQNKFINFNQREIDFAELERLELEQLKEAIGNDVMNP